MVALRLMLQQVADHMAFMACKECLQCIPYCLDVLTSNCSWHSAQEADGHVLPESCAILRYLAQKHSVTDHWYPGESLSPPKTFTLGQVTNQPVLKLPLCN